MADAADLKSATRKSVPVRVREGLPISIHSGEYMKYCDLTPEQQRETCVKEATMLLKRKKEWIKENKLGPEFVLANHLHDTFCTSNHTDQCGWYYDKWELAASVTSSLTSKGMYLERAQTLLKELEILGISPSLASTIVTIVAKSRY